MTQRRCDQQTVTLETLSVQEMALVDGGLKVEGHDGEKDAIVRVRLTSDYFSTTAISRTLK